MGCVPASGACDCTPGNDGAKKPCTSQNPIGECFGFQTCDGATGWQACDAPTPGPELCNGLDDDCNGLVDDELPSTKPCETEWPGIGACAGEATCFGSAGWVCNAPTPTVDVCDFKDNDCDGETDGPFKNEDGLYVSDEHCGACGTACSNAIPNATAACDATSGTALCVVQECDEGFFQVNEFLCLPEGQTTCKPCTVDGQCDGKQCVEVDGSLHCADPCADDGDCEAGDTCQQAFDPDLGGDAGFCLPENGTCDCGPSTDGAKKPCQVENLIGTCVGFQTCDPATGWSECSASLAIPEICDGADNDCDGKFDEDLPLAEPCEIESPFGACEGVQTCQGNLGWVCSADEPGPEVCDFLDNDCDGTADEDYKNADGKYADFQHCGSCNSPCGGSIPGAETEKCDGSKPKPVCVVDTCEDGLYKLNDFQCVEQPDTACLPCEKTEDCFGGTCAKLGDGDYCLSSCQGDVDCNPGFVCDGSLCQPSSGSCGCTVATEGVKKFCSVANEYGTCAGFSVCDPSQGWLPCDAGVPGEEICNGLDDDCNGVPDDGLPAAKPCANTNDFGTCNGDALCQGSVGWVCTAAEPTFELCDFKDNDCDGEIDEDFKNAEGKYASAFHCGTCGAQCGQTVANSGEEVCDTTKAVPQCVAVDCEDGYYLKTELQCVQVAGVSCTPCVADDVCLGGKCTALGGGSFCLEPCSSGCKSGFSCFDGSCHPDNGTCDCGPATAGQQRTCSATNDLGTCLGLETCDPQIGWTGCTAPDPDVEDCDGEDNDCNGLIDDGLPPTQLCFNKNVFGVCGGNAQCFGSGGWVCLAPEPGPETCDFKDNDCDGETDEDYKDSSGKYSTAEHCGTCNNTCGDQYDNSASEVCDASGTVPQCVINECEDGYLKLNDFQCLEIPDVQCAPCASDANCFGASCSDVDTGNWCLVACEAGQCDDGYFCSEGLCRPNNGTCDCTEETDGNKRTCSVTNDLGLCYGFETCDPALGWTGCDALPAEPEICDGQDNDCDGFLDEGLPETQPCDKTNQFGTCSGNATCFGTVGWFCTAPAPEPEQCDFNDNDCDGQTDEDFKDALGKYSSDEHCGSCNTECDGAILNATSVCDGAKAVPQCVVNECDIGWEKFNEFLCIPIASALCESCDTDDNCVAEGAKCISLIDGNKCGIACDADNECPTAFTCIDPGVGVKQCVPATGTCDCDGSNLELQKACKEEYQPPAGGPVQTCFGTNYCTATGWTGCTLPTELCNSLDDDCDGATDEIFLNPQGKLATPEHCGKCNRNCAQLSFINALGVCDPELPEPDCTFVCKTGFFDTNSNPADGCECEWQTSTDKPDGIDQNCDGIDGEVDNGVFVAKTGSDDNPGTLALPMLTVQAAITMAENTGKRDVYVNTSVYSENVALKPGISVYGGYSADFSQRNTVLYETAIIGVQPSGNKQGAVNATSISGAGEATHFDGFTVFGFSSGANGQSSYAIYVRNSDSRLRITNNRVLAGNGAPGAAGAGGVDGVSGSGGGDGANATDIGSCGAGLVATGGSGGTHTCGGTTVSGGGGGAGYCPNYNTSAQNSGEGGSAGANGGGAGGQFGYDGVIAPLFGGGGCSTGAGCGSCIIPPNNLPMQGADGVDGSSGASGSAGQGCTATAGDIVNGLWIAGQGIAGAAAKHGGGGGGGGAGNGVQTCNCGAYGGHDLGGLGGGGGSGACGSTGGKGGTGGGGSFGMFMYYDNPPLTPPLVQNNAIQRGLGGAGGSGGNAGVGGIGGLGGKGGASGTGATITFCAGKGGNGGKGGDGGHGGGGGGGCGGSSYAIYASGQGGVDFTTMKTTNSVLPGGASGEGGQGGLSLGSSGQGGALGAFSISNF